MITQLAHINFFSDQPKEMIDFYVQKLGLKIAFTLDHENGEPFGWYIECGKMSFIEIFDQAGAVQQWGGTVEQLKSGSRFRHVCFEVKDLESYRNVLAGRNVPITAVTVGMDNSKQAWVKDPDGNDIELMEYTPASFQVRAPKK
ncbi:MAG: VOC family protein [Ignavibacteriae bacterium]|nr:MAG: VOC family protein [Ignavibacteriota bacterium]